MVQVIFSSDSTMTSFMARRAGRKAKQVNLEVASGGSSHSSKTSTKTKTSTTDTDSWVESTTMDGKKKKKLLEMGRKFTSEIEAVLKSPDPPASLPLIGSY